MIKYYITNGVLEGVAYGGGPEDVVLEIPSTVKRIKKVRIYREIKKIIIPSTILEIDVDAFEDGNKVFEIVSESPHFIVENNSLFNKEKTILYLVSRDYRNIFVSPSSLLKIGSHCFAHCWRVKEICLNNNIDYIGEYAFGYCENLRKINLPTSHELELKHALFIDCHELDQIIIPKNVINIDRSVFFDCYNLEKVIIESNKITKIGEQSFKGCKSLVRLDFLEGVISIGGGAFMGCTDLTEISLPKTVENLSWDIFKWDDKLTVVSSSRQVVEYCKNHNIVYLVPSDI